MSVVALCGGVGGAKLALGLSRALPPGALTVVVNTGDDFDHLGLRVCPDLDTVIYTLAGVEESSQGWGRRDETWSMMRTLELLGEETWFKLGDADTALHIARSRQLKAGLSLSQVIHDFRTRFGISSDIVPMTDDRVETRLITDEGDLAFQEYFVKRRCQPRTHSIRFVGAAEALPAPAAIDHLSAPTLEAIILCPSNPYLSVDPMLAISGLRAVLNMRRAPLVAVSPLIHAQAVKGPTAKIMHELGIPVTPMAIYEHYRGLLDGLIIDTADIGASAQIPIPVFPTATLMQSLHDRVRLAHFALDCARALRNRGAARVQVAASNESPYSPVIK